MSMVGMSMGCVLGRMSSPMALNTLPEEEGARTNATQLDTQG